MLLLTTLIAVTAAIVTVIFGWRINSSLELRPAHARPV
jgi:hypothetical protein